MIRFHARSWIWMGLIMGALVLAGSIGVMIGNGSGSSAHSQENPPPVASSGNAAVPEPSTSQDGSTFSLISPPSSLYQLVVEADAIVIASVVEVAFEQDERPFSLSLPQNDSNSTDARPGRATSTPAVPEMRFTYYRLQIEEVLLDDGRIDSGSEVLLRVDGSASQGTGTYENLAPLPQVGQRALFVLNVNPDQQSYGTRGPWGRINLHGTPVSYDDWAETPLPFATGISAQEFLSQLEAMIDEVQREKQRSR